MSIHTIHSLSRFLTIALLVSLTGCGGDEIRSYDVPKVAGTPDAAKANGNAGQSNEGARLLAAIVPHGKQIWHFKLMGSAALLNPQADAFVKFVESIKFTTTKEADGSETSTAVWKLPAGWSERAGSGMRYATIIVGEQAHGLELTVFRFGPESGDILPNVQRWAGQIGVNNVTPGKLADMTRPLIVDGQAATLVDVAGPGAAGDPSMAGPPRPQPPQPPQAPAKPERIVATAPQGWTEDPNPGQFLISKYEITQDGNTATLTVSSAGGDIEANLNRWRNQIGLAEWDETSIQKAFEDQKELIQAELGGRRAILINIASPESAGENRERILGALTSNPSGAIWFIKFRGPAALVEAQKPAFDGFLKSIRFEQ